ncbi:putative pectinesterase/pectinesterase inhibitor 22 [Bidens hawaiensis]|uniref:putative pectinesterase/pectinesterase inhibitor 22 n=1 Tax=Bidens hawaiensis TaxID=980011 RepID=UPI004048F863
MTLPTFVVFSLIFSPLIMLVSSQTLNHQEQTMENPLILQACSNIDDRNTCLSNVKSFLDNDNHSSVNQKPESILRAALKATLKETQLAMQTFTRFTSLSSSSREQMATEDCKELLDFSVSELAWSVAEMKEIRSGSQNPHYHGNLKAWLSAALSNQDTCLEGFEGTDRHLESFIRGSLTQVTQLISNVLALYTQLQTLPFKPPRNYGGKTNTFYPHWMSEGDKELMLASPNGMQTDVVVALDGSGHYRSISEAINDAPSYSNRRYIIYMKRGVYKENVDMKKKKTNIMLVGDGIGATVVTGDRNFMQGWTTFRTATVAVSGRGFIARDITFRNTAGPQNHQGVALRVDSDQSAFYRCSMEGYQDTLYVHSLRQFYRECTISGTIDFIFGNGAAVLQNCKIYTRDPLPLQKVTITAQGRKNPNQNTGFSIQDSFVYATKPTYLGRPWKEYSRTVFMNTYMSAMVQPRGWLEWYGNFALSTLWYGEYRNYGPGASLSGRVQWPGYHMAMDASTADSFTVRRFIDGLAWLPATGVSFSAGLSK